MRLPFEASISYVVMNVALGLWSLCAGYVKTAALFLVLALTAGAWLIHQRRAARSRR